MPWKASCDVQGGLVSLRRRCTRRDTRRGQPCWVATHVLHRQSQTKGAGEDGGTTAERQHLWSTLDSDRVGQQPQQEARQPSQWTLLPGGQEEGHHQISR